MSKQKERLMRSGGVVDADCELEDKKTVGDLDFMNVEGDGVLDVIYEVLWTTWDSKSTLEIVVPDTVVFRFDKAIAWYYTKMIAEEEGEGGSARGPAVPRLHKKKEEVLRNQIILESFLKSAKGGISEVVAYFICHSSSSGGGHSGGSGAGSASAAAS
eukprot:RCo023932